MNAERLHAIAAAVRNDLRSSDVPNLINQLVTALTNLASQPGQPEYQRQVSATVAALELALLSAEVNDFSPTWRQVLEETGLDRLLGARMAQAIKATIGENQMTPSVAVNQVQELATDLQRLSSHLDNVLAAFTYLDVGAEDLVAGECEVGVLVPREFVSNRLDKFADELDELNKILGSFAELATGARAGFEIRAISSSDLSIFLDAAPVVGACIAVAVERIVGLYKQLLEVRKLQGELAKQGVDKKHLKGVEDHANDLMDNGIDTLVKELIKEFSTSKDTGRTNELSVELKYSMKKIANRVDRGFNIEVRMAEPAAAEEGTEAAAGEQVAAAYGRIQGAAEGMQFLRLEGDPILSLQEDAGKHKKPDSKSPG